MGISYQNAGYAVRFGSHVLMERLARPIPIAESAVPSSAEALTPRWLTKVLCEEHPGAEVVAVQVYGGSDGTSSRREIEVAYNDVGSAAGLPTRLFGKATPRASSRIALAATGKVANEVGFYNSVRPHLSIEATEALYAGYHARSGRSFILFEDLTVQGVTFCSPATYVSREMAEDMVKLMADYHGPMWEDPRLESDFPWLRTTEKFQEQINRSFPFEKRSYVGIERACQFLPSVLLRQEHALWSCHARSLEINSTRPMTMLHWDMHIGNWYQTAGGRMGLSDWGMVRGQWAGDVAYALSSALTVDDRRAWERDLLAVYLDRLNTHVSAVPTAEEAWLAYRQQMLHPFFYWAVTFASGRLLPDMQPDPITITNLKRVGQALVDLETVASVV